MSQYIKYPNPDADSTTIMYGTTSGALTLTVPAIVTDYTLIFPAAQGGALTFLRNDGAGNLSWVTDAGGSVTSVSVVSANGLAGSVATSTTTPAITLSVSITGVLKGNGTAISAATVGTDYSVGTSALATGILKSTTSSGALSIAVAGDFPTLNQNTSGTAANVTGTVAIANGGTGQVTANAALNAFLPSQGSASGKVLTSNGTDASWVGASIYDAGNSSTALTFNFNNGVVQKSAITGNVTFTLSNPVVGETYVLELNQDATGSRTYTWPGTVKWPAGTAPTGSAANKKDLVTLFWDGTDYLGNYSLNY